MASVMGGSRDSVRSGFSPPPLAPFFCVGVILTRFLPMVAHGRRNPPSRPIVVQRYKTSTLPIIPVNIPEPTFPGLPWVTWPSLSQSWGPDLSLVFIPRAWGWGVSPTRITESGGGGIPPKRPGAQLPEEGGRVARLTKPQTSTAATRWMGAGPHREPSFPIPSSLRTTTPALSVA